MERFGVEKLAEVLMNFNREGIEEYDENVYSLMGMGSYSYTPKKLDLDFNNHPTPPTKQSIEKIPLLELKQFPSHMRYVFLGDRCTLQ